MTAPSGRTYRIQIDVFVEAYVTILDDGNLVLEDALTGDYLHIDRNELHEFENSSPPYSAHVAECIRRDLLCPRHDDCDWPFEPQPEKGWWYRQGKCPTCEQW